MGGKKYKVALSDSNCNGRFDERMSQVPDVHTADGSLYFKGDLFFLTGDKELDGDDGLLLGDGLIVGGQLFDTKVDLAGGKLVLTPHEGATGKLKLAAAPETMELFSPDFKHAVIVAGSGAELTLPEGDYSLYKYSLKRKDAAGANWRLDATATKDAAVAKVTAGGAAELKFGEPFVPVTVVPEWARQNMRNAGGSSQQSKGLLDTIGNALFGDSGGGGRSSPGQQVDLQFDISGQGKEKLSGLTLLDKTTTAIELSKENPDRPKEPTYKILKPDGEVVTQGTFEYG